MKKKNEQYFGFNRKVGYPPKYENPAQLIEAISKYFNKIPFEKWTITGICLVVGSRATFYKYSKLDDYKDIITDARLMVENSYETSLREKGGSGNIFALKNLGDWVDKTENTQQLTVSTQPPVVIDGNEQVFEIGEDVKQIENKEGEQE